MQLLKNIICSPWASCSTVLYSKGRAVLVKSFLRGYLRRWYPGHRVPKSHLSMLVVHIWAWSMVMLQLWLQEQSILLYIHGEVSRKPGLSGFLDNVSELMWQEHCLLPQPSHCRFLFFSWELTDSFFPFGLGKWAILAAATWGKPPKADTFPGKLPHSSWTEAPQDPPPFTGVPRTSRLSDFVQKSGPWSAGLCWAALEECKPRRIMEKEKIKSTETFSFVAQPPSHPIYGGKAHRMKCRVVQ